MFLLCFHSGTRPIDTLPQTPEVNRKALLRVVAGLFAMVGLVPVGPVPRLMLALRFAVLRLLRPAESAARRLIVVAAEGLSVAVRPSRPFTAKLPKGDGKRPRLHRFTLFDRLKWFVELRKKRGPVRRTIRICVPGCYEPPPAVLAPAKPTSAVLHETLRQRLEALKRALDDLPGEARRLARWRARQAARPRPGRRRSSSPLRSGLPPGHRAREIHRVDGILKDCHRLALYALMPP